MSASTSSAPGSVTGSPVPPLQQLLSEQLQALSLVGETLTVRLLELEERLSALEGQLAALQQTGSGGSGNDALEMLASTEARIARMESLLIGEQNLRPGHSAAGVHLLPQRSSDELVEAEPKLNPFPEEEEQPFMDELSA